MVLVGSTEQLYHGSLLRRKDDAVRVDPADHAPGNERGHVTEVEFRRRRQRLVLVPATAASGQHKTMTGHFTVRQHNVNVTVYMYMYNVKEWINTCASNILLYNV